MASSIDSLEKNKDCIRVLFEALNESSLPKLQLARGTALLNQLLTKLSKCKEEDKTPLVIEIIGIFIQYVNCGRLKLIAQVINKSISFTRVEKIFALEFIGAALINGPAGFEYYLFALHCWKEALTYRYFSQEQDDEPLPKQLAVCVPSTASSVVFESAVEFMTMEDLKSLQEDLEPNYFMATKFPHVFQFLPCTRRVRIQALLVMRRITGQANLNHLTGYYLKNLLDFAEPLTNFKGFPCESKILINTYLLILEQITGMDKKMLTRIKSFDVFMKALHRSAKFFLDALWPPSYRPNPEREQLSYANFLVPTEFIAVISRVFPILLKDSSVNGSLMSEVFSCLSILDSISSQITDKEKQKLEECYSIFIRNSPERTKNLLHVAVERFGNLDETFKIQNIIQLILKLRADPNAIDEEGRTPLQILAKKPLYGMDEYVPVFQILVDGGSHLDYAADNGDTVLSILKESSKPLHPYLETLVKTVLPLKCYAARVIRRHGIDGYRLPSSLQGFVARHSAKGCNE